jgi:hypothetical protein
MCEHENQRWKSVTVEQIINFLKDNPERDERLDELVDFAWRNILHAELDAIEVELNS